MILSYNHPKAATTFLRGFNIRPDLGGLTVILQSFLQFPYENLTKIINSKTAKNDASFLRLPEIIVDEHEKFGAGGTCFSLTYFFETILKYIGFDCYTVMVDRSYGKNTHCALMVTLDRQKYLVDPGYCLSKPIPIYEKEMEHKLPHNTYIVTPSPFVGEGQGEGKSYSISTKQQGSTKHRYLLKDMPVSPEEFLKHWKDSFNWSMMGHLLITRLSEDGYLYLRDDFVRHTTGNDKKQEHIKKDFDKRVTELFGLSPQIVELATNIIYETKS